MTDNTHYEDSTVLRSLLVTPSDEDKDGLCMTFNFAFNRLESVDLSLLTESGNSWLLWRLTKSDAHSIPERKWMLGEVLLNHTRNEKYWVGVT